MLGIKQEALKSAIKNKKIEPSKYKPNEEVRKLFTLINEDLQVGRRFLTKPWPEFNNRTLEKEMDETLKAFNTWIPQRRTDPLHSWRAQTRRPILRNKLINTIAHATKATLIPAVYSYDNTTNESDDISAIAMRSMINWVIQNTDYSEQFVNFVTDVVTQPAGILEVGYAYATRTIRENGEMKEVIDDEFSGHYFETVPCNELLIENPYESNIQKQRWVARRKKIGYTTAKALYGKMENFDAVVPGKCVTVDTESGLFYEMRDPDIEDGQVEEIKYYNRSQDLEVTMLNGVIIGDPFQGNSYAHKKYPFVKTPYEPVNGGKFFWGKSQANKLLPDEEVINTLRNMFIDGTFLQLMPPFAIVGAESAHQLVMVPGASSAFEDEAVKLQNIGPNSDIRGGLLAMQEVEKSIVETSSDSYRAGNPANLPDRMPAYNMAKLEENAEAQLGLLMGAITRSVAQVSEILVSNILQYNTAPELASALGPDITLKYPTFIVNNEEDDGQNVVRKIVFNPNFFTSEKTAKDLSYDVLRLEGLQNKDERIVMINPPEFRNLKFKVHVGSDTLRKKNTIIEKALKLEAYDRLRTDPIIASNAKSMSRVTQDFLLGAIAPGQSARYLPDQQPISIPQNEMKQKAPTQNITGQITGSNSLEGMMAVQNDEELSI